MGEQKEDSVTNLIVKGIMQIVDVSKTYNADHEIKYPPLSYKVFERIGPFKRTLLKISRGKKDVSVESRYFRKEYLKTVFSELETIHPEIHMDYKTD